MTRRHRAELIAKGIITATEEESRETYIKYAELRIFFHNRGVTYKQSPFLYPEIE